MNARAVSFTCVTVYEDREGEQHREEFPYTQHFDHDISEDDLSRHAEAALNRRYDYLVEHRSDVRNILALYLEAAELKERWWLIGSEGAL